MRSPFLFPILGKRYSLDVSTNEDSGIQLTPLCCIFFTDCVCFHLVKMRV